MYGSAIEGKAGLSMDAIEDDMSCLMQTILEHVPEPEVEVEAPFQMQISALDYSSYVGVIGLGRVARGSVKKGDQVTVVSSTARVAKVKFCR